MAEEWRRVIAALLNPSLRRAFADVVRGDADGIRPQDLATLTAAGLVRTADGIRVDEDALRALLAAPVARAERAGLDRFLRADGRVDRYPSSPTERRALLARIAAEALEPGDDLPERAFTERLAAFADDPASLRRYLVDESLVERTRTGSSYRLVAAPSEDDETSGSDAPR